MQNGRGAQRAPPWRAHAVRPYRYATRDREDFVIALRRGVPRSARNDTLAGVALPREECRLETLRLKASAKASHRERPADHAGGRAAPSFAPDVLSASAPA